MSESKQGFPLFGSWLTGTRARSHTRTYNTGRDGAVRHQQRSSSRRTWRDVMEAASGKDNTESSAHSSANADSWRRPHNTTPHLSTGRQEKGDLQPPNVAKQSNLYHQVAPKTSKSLSNSPRGVTELLYLNEHPVEVDLFPHSSQCGQEKEDRQGHLHQDQGLCSEGDVGSWVELPLGPAVERALSQTRVTELENVIDTTKDCPTPERHLWAWEKQTDPSNTSRTEAGCRGFCSMPHRTKGGISGSAGTHRRNQQAGAEKKGREPG